MDLTNHLLLAMPDVDDPFFEKSVVYICEHNADGAVGLVINKPSPLKMGVVFGAVDLNLPERFEDDPVMIGGPVQLDRGYVLHRPVGNWQSSLVVNDNTALTTSRDIIESLANGETVDKAMISIGYASWTAGQLERELGENTWLTVPADEYIVFDLPYAKKYGAALAKLGVGSESLMREAGHA
ncbi:YqgE/AlgH family protein [Neisseria weaveri]|uniref:YqgE/AlgH family protein n=1 Tax=Neisseria weaveri TaxID=28091 RepID=UPI0007C9C6DC|nr:YqgE/AlgH family protein [Neisseria weaveri]SAY51168.1 Uncharacterized ACR, COG1678 [Neisseria weaveri]